MNSSRPCVLGNSAPSSSPAASSSAWRCSGRSSPTRDFGTPPPTKTAADELAAFAEKWDERFPSISRAWQRWEHVTPFLAFPPDLHRIVCTTS